MGIVPFDLTFLEAVRAGGPDANDRPAERATSNGIPCHSCLNHVPSGAPCPVLATCPFPDPQPYAETGPIFFCTDACRPWRGEGLPPTLTSSPEYLVRGYTADHRILYGSGGIVGQNAVRAELSTRLDDPGVAFVSVALRQRRLLPGAGLAGRTVLTMICDNTRAIRNNGSGLVFAAMIEQPAGRPRCPVP